MKDVFTQLCEDLATLAGIPRRSPRVDPETGAAAFPLELHGFEVHLTCGFQEARDCLSRVLFQCAGTDEPWRFWDDLLAANFQLYPATAPSFASDPWTHDAVIQQAWPEGTTAAELWLALSKHCEFAATAQRGEPGAIEAGLRLLSSPAASAAAEDNYIRAAQRFTRLIQQLRTTQGLAQLASREIHPGLQACVLRAEDIQLQLWLSAHRPSCLQLAVDLCPRPSPPDATALGLAQANALLLVEPNRRVICRMPFSPCYTLCCEIPLEDDAARLLDWLTSAVAASRTLIGLAPSPSSGEPTGSLNHHE